MLWATGVYTVFATMSTALSAVYVTLQVLQSLPIIAAPPKVVETPPAPWPAAAEADEVLLTVPGQAALLPLQPSKLAVFKLFTEQVCCQCYCCHSHHIAAAACCCFPTTTPAYASLVYTAAHANAAAAA